VHTLSRIFPITTRLVRGGPEFWNLLTGCGIGDFEALCSRELGHTVTASRSSWVRRVVSDTIDLYVKVYDYRTAASRWRGALRNTSILCRSRAAREWDALAWFRSRGLPGPAPLAVVERRGICLLRRAVLVTATWPAERCDHLLARIAAEDRGALLRSLIEFVQRIHAAGFRDRNLDLRNLLAQRRPGGWEIAKIDSPRFCLRPAQRHDRLARADWQRLGPQLQPFGFTVDDRGGLRPT